MNRRHRTGITCPRTGMTKYRCTCHSCVEFQQEWHAWNVKLKAEGDEVVRPTTTSWSLPRET